MKSSSGAHFVGLDHLRALAAYMVFIWHFVHGRQGSPIPFEGAPAFYPLALLDEGHTGVALFMVLSGYLFARLLAGRSIRLSLFFYNRCLRLLPLLVFVILLAGGLLMIQGADSQTMQQFVQQVLWGWWRPSLPNGGWSITVEFHFYLLLPLLLIMMRRSLWALPVLMLGALVFRVLWFWQEGEVQSLAYLTLVGRLDQFLAGMVFAGIAPWFKGRHTVALTTLAVFTAFYAWFDRVGGFYGFGGYPAKTVIWVYLPTLEALAYATLIAWYDQSFSFHDQGWSGRLAKVGSYSYAIYLLHPFWVFAAATWVHEQVMPMTSFGVAWAWGTVFFVLAIPMGALSMAVIEKPFLRLRRRYTL